MNFGRIDVALGDVCEVKQGRYLSPEQMSTVETELAAVPVYGANGILGYTDQTAYQEPVTLITCRGSYCGKIQRTSSSAWISNNAMACKPTKPVDSRYLHYVLRATEFGDVVTGSAQPQITLGNLRPKRITITENVEEQLNIAATLGALDDKIESNRRVMELEFLLAVNVLTAGSTEPVRVGEVAAMTKGLSYKGSGLDDGSTPGAVEMINLANFTTSGQMKAEGVKHYTGEFKTTHRLSELDLIVANTDLTQDREILGRGFLLPPRHVGAIHTHHTSVVRFQDGKQWMTPFLWARLQSPDFRDRAKGFATGTTVTALPAETLLDFEFTVPLDPEMIAAQGNALIRHAWQLKDETECLSRTRNTLLPELLSGRIRVPEAKQAVAEVVA